MCCGAGACLDGNGRTLSGRELRTAATAGKLARMGTRRGYPDFMIFHADGRVDFLEVKRPGGKLTSDEAHIAARMIRAGHRFTVVDSFKAAVSVLVTWGVVRGVGVQ
jgi:hypothetical protein